MRRTKRSTTRTSKYVGKTYGKWKITHMGVASVGSAHMKHPFSRHYYYVAERITSDSKCEKLIRLNDTDMTRVGRKEITIEKIAKSRQKNNEKKFTRKVSYHFLKAKKRAKK